ncbi:hypothetical protein BC567DRAFT_223349 [Phyllosticta citribraziliensis]
MEEMLGKPTDTLTLARSNPGPVQCHPPQSTAIMPTRSKKREAQSAESGHPHPHPIVFITSHQRTPSRQQQQTWS